MPYTPNDSTGSPAGGATIAQKCLDLQQAKNRRDLGERIALLVLQHSPAEIQRMKQNFSNKIQDITPEYRDRLAKKITEHLLGTYQRIHISQQQGVFKTMHEPVTEQ
jgi:predicted Zn-dependent protease with MMP-like domain